MASGAVPDHPYPLPHTLPSPHPASPAPGLPHAQQNSADRPPVPHRADRATANPQAEQLRIEAGEGGVLSQRIAAAHAAHAENLRRADADAEAARRELEEQAARDREACRAAETQAAGLRRALGFAAGVCSTLDPYYVAFDLDRRTLPPAPATAPAPASTPTPAPAPAPALAAAAAAPAPPVPPRGGLRPTPPRGSARPAGGSR